ncbi:tetratricopeptide repeat protein [Sulfitobacter sp. JBTF-M27]|uniref:Tetratricopeptide repeat protein n=1 Tax=Sulfitobacter sediminilitoris TaxID=2698830 RepID=A0A6P0CG78_9RHOB|nr:adenylate/guanylate cyclase domain-containing protein [Sulfitobacter sediminilitoris]NEK25152.1 tetratricopeptide repeat protein [Sulfitobacter sediminilitoris]
MDRRLSAIMVADMVGYSRLMERDEESTIQRQKAHRNELIDPILADHQGTIIKTTGDGFLAEFRSVVDAVKCAVQIQRTMLKKEEALSKDQRINYRIGVNLGDVVHEDGDVYGDGVNVAARLEQLADPGGICISGTAFDHLRKSVQVGYEDLGEVHVKNIERPIRAWKVLLDQSHIGDVIVPHKSIWNRSPKPVAAALVTAVLLVAAIWWLWSSPDQVATSQHSGSLQGKQSIAVLPFQDHSETPEIWLSDGLAEDIITDLSKLEDLFVIARNSSFQYRGGNHDLRQVGLELGVAHLLEGSVRRVGDTVRVNAQLIEAETGGHLWAERYDGSADEIFELQDAVTQKIVDSLALTLTKSEVEAITLPVTEVPKAHQAYLRAVSHLHQYSPQSFTEAKKSLDEALELDPTHALALAGRADLYLEAAQRGWWDSVGIDKQYNAVYAAAEAALRYPSALAHAVEAELLFEKPDHEAARAAVQKGLALDPNNVDVQIFSAMAEISLGNYEGALDRAKFVERLDPRNPNRYQYVTGLALHVAGKNVEALDYFDKVLKYTPEDFTIRVTRAIILSELGRFEEAKAEMQIVEAKWPKDWGNTFSAPIIAWWYGRNIGQDYVIRLRRALLAIGVPLFPDGVEVEPQNRMSLVEVKSDFGDTYRWIGECCGGVQWMRDTHQSGERDMYLNGKKVGTDTAVWYEDGTVEFERHHRYMHTSKCDVYRNPDGLNDEYNAFIAVCSNGVFPFGVFPIPS